MHITGHTNIDTVLAELATIEAKGQRMAPLFEELANHLYNLADEAFEDETSPDGSAWQPLSPLTIERKGHDRKLHKTGHLRETLEYASDSKSATIGTNAISDNGYPYPAVHQFGTDDGKVPARPFMPFTNDGDLMGDATASLKTMIKQHFNDD